MIGKAVPNFTEWGLSQLRVGREGRRRQVHRLLGCHLCVVACDDGTHRCIHPVAGPRVPRVDESECVGCNLCPIVSPTPGRISMEKVDNGFCAGLVERARRGRQAAAAEEGRALTRRACACGRRMGFRGFGAATRVWMGSEGGATSGCLRDPRRG